jgi:hypothetical protein
MPGKPAGVQVHQNFETELPHFAFRTLQLSLFIRIQPTAQEVKSEK